MTITPKITASRLREVLAYDAETGVLSWRVATGSRAKVGDQAGSVENMKGGLRRRTVFVDGCRYKAHRLAWLYMTGQWPDGIVDHKNNNGLDNRFFNLRIATPTQSVWNTCEKAGGKSGVKGVSLFKRTGKWRAEIRDGGKKRHLGYYATVDDAKAAYEKAAMSLHGEWRYLKTADIIV